MDDDPGTADIDALLGNRMSESAVDAFLREQGTGILALARDGESYAVPLSFGYDGNRMYFVFVGYHAESRKTRFADATDRATLTTYAVESVTEWQSVIVSGRLERTPEEEWETARAAIEDTAWYPSLFRQADPRGSVTLWTLVPDEMTGYAGPDARTR